MPSNAYPLTTSLIQNSWRTNIIGVKTLRLDYSDQLRQPQAEVEFETLLSFLLDLGAIPHAPGFRMLRGAGLWVPIGTPLLVSPDGSEPVLTIAPLDDSDGFLSLSVRWSSHWGMRDHTSLPPYWVLLKGPAPAKLASITPAVEKSIFDQGTADTACVDNEKKSSAQIKYCPPTYDNTHSPAIRCQIGLEGIVTAKSCAEDAELFEDIDISHLKDDGETPNTTGAWFASAITALGTSSQTILWNYKISYDILAFAKKESVPCGVLVLLDVVEESITPEWATLYDDEEDESHARMKKLQEQSRAMMRESRMTPSERSAAAFDRQRQQHEDWVEESRSRRRLEAQRAETRLVEAIHSPKWSNKLVAEHNLKWLKKNGHVDSEEGLKQAVEVMLWQMINNKKFAAELGSMLDQWKAFVDNGGMRRAEYAELKEKQILFAQASLIVAMIDEVVTATHGSLALDLQECVRIWKKVRLG